MFLAAAGSNNANLNEKLFEALDVFSHRPNHQFLLRIFLKITWTWEKLEYQGKFSSQTGQINFQMIKKALKLSMAMPT